MLAVDEMQYIFSLINDLLDKSPPTYRLRPNTLQSTASSTSRPECYSLFGRGSTQTLFMDRAFVGDEQGLIRVLGLAVVVIGWFYLFGGRSAHDKLSPLRWSTD